MSPDEISTLVRDGGSFLVLVFVMVQLLRREDRWMKLLDGMDQRHTETLATVNETMRGQTAPVLAAIDSSRNTIIHVVERAQDSIGAMYTEREQQDAERARITREVERSRNERARGSDPDST